MIQDEGKKRLSLKILKSILRITTSSILNDNSCKKISASENMLKKFDYDCMYTKDDSEDDCDLAVLISIQSKKN